MTHTLRISHNGTHNGSATPDANGNYVVAMVRKGLSDTEITPANIRTNPTTRALETTLDGGTTWTPAPGQDPRHADQFRVPVRGGSQPACDAAANMRARFKASMDALISASGVITGMQLSLAIIVQFMFEVGWIIDALLYVVSALIGAGSSALNTAMTTAVYDELEMIFFCNINSDGSVTAAQFATIQAEINDRIGGDAATFSNILLDFWGEVGLSNAGATGTAVGSCGSFDCSLCFTIDFAVSDGSAYGVILQHGSYVPGSGWIGLNLGPNDNTSLALYWVFPETMHIVGYGTFFDKGGGAGADNLNTNRLFLEPTPGLVDIDAANPSGNGLTKFKAISSTDATEFDVVLDAGSGGFDVTLRSMTIHYNRATPIWTPNC